MQITIFRLFFKLVSLNIEREGGSKSGVSAGTDPVHAKGAHSDTEL